MTLKHLLNAANVVPVEVLGDAQLSNVQSDSRKIEIGGLFVCMPGTSRPSEAFIPQAKASGAVATLVHSREGMELAAKEKIAAALIPPGHFDDAAWRICDAFFDHPTRAMKVIGVTGTNGKTTTAWLIRDMLVSLGVRCAYLGTLGFHLDEEERVLENTTPFAVELYNLIAEARDRGAEGLLSRFISGSG
jgi:UDP-N-acetylmuramoyl-L-alanyl-D-glutamate--2,6-diaminopimelate ligase